jgi:hypothetical protein
MVAKGKVLVLTVALVTVGWAGCAGTDPAETEDPDTDEEEALTAEIPRWQLGDAWTYSIDTHGFPQTETTMMVYNETADLYRIGSTDEDTALQHAIFEVNPQLGRLQKGNLGVYEKGEPRSMYDFPIQDGDEWTTSFFVRQHEGELDAEATYSDAIETEAGTFEGFEIVAEGDDGFRLAYDYIPEIQWFSKLIVTDQDGTQLHELRLQDHERETSGTGYFVRPDKLHDQSYTSEDCSFPSGCTDQVLVDGASAKDGKYGPYDLVAYNVVVSIPNPDNDRASVQITDGEGNEIYSRQDITSSEGDEFEFETVRDFEPGDWTIDVSTQNDAEVDVALAGGWSYSGTVE